MIRQKDNPILDKSFNFAVRIVNLYKYLTEKQKEFVLSKQILRSGTSIGANVHESIEGSSEKDFQNKLNIALKEARETEYWLKLLHQTEYIDERQYSNINDDCSEILRILVSIIKTLNQKKEPNQKDSQILN